MAQKSFQLVVDRVPAWVGSGLDVKKLANDALESIGNELERRQGRGMGARRNTITRQRSPENLSQRVLSSRIYPRRSGRSWQLKGESRFRGMAPRAVKKYITDPLRTAWSVTRAA